MKLIIFILRNSVNLHKLQYSKTIKSDIYGALFGLLVSVVVGYLTLATFGGCSLDLTDLMVLVYYFLLIYWTLYMLIY